MRARADVRARPISLMAVTVLVGLIGAVAIAALAGARQTDSAYARYRAASNEPEAGVVDCANGFFSPPFDLAAVSNDRSVAARAVVALGPANLVSSDGKQLLYASPDLAATVIALRDPADAAVYEPHVIAGRLPSSSNEIAVGYVDPARTGAPRPAIGDTVEIQMVPAAAAASGRIPSDPSKAVVIPAHVTGWVLGAGELVGDAPGIWAGAGFLEAHGDEVWTCDAGIYHLRGGFSGLTPFLANLYEVEPRAALFFNSTAEKVFVERSTHLAAIELRVLALLAGIAGIMILGQFLVRRTSLGAIDTPVLRAIGMTRAQIVWAAALPAVAVACVGALIAIAGAMALSPLFPIGLARIMDPDVGVRGDGLAILVGVAIIAATTILSVVIPAGRLASTRTGPEGAVEYRGSVRRSALASWLARLPLPASAGAGARLALEPGHGRSATPGRSAVIGLSISVAAMVAAFGFAASMDHFGATPRLYGLNFGFGAGNPFIGDAFQKQAVPVIEADPGLRDLAVGNFQQLVTLLGPGGEVPEIAWALERVKGAQVAPTMLEGRWPESPNEIAVGADTLRKLGSQVGETVTVVVGDRRRDLTVVGVPVFPDFGFGPGLGQGVGTTLEGLRFFYPTVTENLTLGNLAEGSDPAAVVKRLNQAVLRDLDAQALTADNAPQGTTVGATVDSRGLPLQLSILFAFAAFATLVHVLLTSVRRRRRDLAILQTLGFKRGQVAATVAWQSLILASLALVFGVPIGMLVGRLGWSAFAYRLGIVNEPVLSPLSFIVIPVMLAVALLVSLGPGLVARRVKPAAVLKAE
jgi:hypothetical protein